MSPQIRKKIKNIIFDTKTPMGKLFDIVLIMLIIYVLIKIIEKRVSRLKLYIPTVHVLEITAKILFSYLNEKLVSPQLSPLQHIILMVLIQNIGNMVSDLWPNIHILLLLLKISIYFIILWKKLKNISHAPFTHHFHIFNILLNKN